MQKIAGAYKKRRKELGLSAKQIADKLGVSPATIYRYESNDIMNMRIDKLQPIAKVLRTTPAYLMGSDESEENNEDSQQQKLLTNYNTDQTKLIDYSDELVNSDKYKETVTISIASRDGSSTLQLTKEQYEKIIELTKKSGRKELPDSII